MEETILKIIVPLIGVLISGFVAYIVARFQVKEASRKLDVEYQRKATEILFLKRIEVYPYLYSILHRMLKNYHMQRRGHNEFLKLVTDFDSWEVENSIFLSLLITSKIRDIRISFQEVLDDRRENKNISNNKWEHKIIPKIRELELALKSELGILQAHSFHNPNKIKKLSDTMRELTQSKRK